MTVFVGLQTNNFVKVPGRVDRIRIIIHKKLGHCYCLNSECKQHGIQYTHWSGWFKYPRFFGRAGAHYIMHCLLPLLNVYSPRAGYLRSLYNTRTVFSAGLMLDSSDGQDLHLFIWEFLDKRRQELLISWKKIWGVVSLCNNVQSYLLGLVSE